MRSTSKPMVFNTLATNEAVVRWNDKSVTPIVIVLVILSP